MKLLFDENVSHKLVQMLAREYPDSAHVIDVGLGGANDSEVWEHAKSNGFTIVSKDSDFRERSYVQGYPPKVIWLIVGNCGTKTIAEILINNRSRIEAFLVQQEHSLLAISG